MRVCIVILNYRTPELVIGCLRSLIRERAELAFEVVVVDNASNDGSVDVIRSELERSGIDSWVHIIESPVNWGFSAGNNVAIRAYDADAYLLLNSDTIVKPGAVRELVRALDAHPEVGLVGARLESEGGAPQLSAFRRLQPSSELVKIAATGLIASAFSKASRHCHSFDRSFYPDWICFAAVLIRREVIEEVGELDEGYFMYFEDTDYCERVNEVGWKVLYWPHAHVVHLHGMSSQIETIRQARARRPKYYYRARSRYFRKHFGWYGFVRANVYWHLGRCVSLAREVLTTSRKVRASCEMEWLDNWTQG
jgi:N-acetylglucosaminyl-diphospho-decaprenol L-rhamnosyltransferase